MVDFRKALEDARTRRGLPEYRCTADILAAYSDSESEAGIVAIAKRHLDEASAAKDKRIAELEAKARALLDFIGPINVRVYASDKPVVELRKALTP